jgi:hypothetical protein
VSSQVALASQEVLCETYAMEKCLSLAGALLADCRARGLVALASEEGQVGDREVIERVMIWSITWGLAGTAVDVEARLKFRSFILTATSVMTPGVFEDNVPLHEWAIDLDSGLWVRWGSVKADETSHMGCGTFDCIEEFVLPTPEMLSLAFLV